MNTEALEALLERVKAADPSADEVFARASLVLDAFAEVAQALLDARSIRLGAEAEDLRRKLEEIVEDDWEINPMSRWARLTLDDVDARDSLAYLESRDDKLLEARAELRRLRRECAELLAISEGDAEVSDSRVMTRIRGIGPALITQWAREALDGPSAVNYVEFKMHDRDRDVDYTLTVQRCEGQTPHDLRLEAEADQQQLLRQLDELRVKWNGLGSAEEPASIRAWTASDGISEIMNHYDYGDG